MATLEDIGVSAFINILSAFAFLLAFALLRIQPINDRIYFPKWYINGARSSPRHSGNFVSKFVNLNFRTYLTFLNWMPQALKMSESEIISRVGLDSAVFLRIYILGQPALFTGRNVFRTANASQSMANDPLVNEVTISVMEVRYNDMDSSYTTQGL